MSTDSSSRVVQLADRNGAPRHEDDKLRRIVEAAVKPLIEGQSDRLVQSFRLENRRLERSLVRLAACVEAYVKGDKDIAIAALTDEEVDDLASLSSIKVDAVELYKLSATEIGVHFGLKSGHVGQLLGKDGLGWVNDHAELWNSRRHKNSPRLWHPKVLTKLREVFEHPEGFQISLRAARIIDRARAYLSLSTVSAPRSDSSE